MYKQKGKAAAVDFILNVAGVCCYAFGMNCFLIPNQIIPGGASGIAVLVHHLTGWPIGSLGFWFNVPLFLIIYRKKLYTLSFLRKTLVNTVILAVVTDLLAAYSMVYQRDMLLAAVCGGSLMGVGLALTYLGESNMGGISLLGVILHRLNDRFPVGILTGSLNVLIVLMSAFIYQNFESLLYALFTAYFSGIIMDKICIFISARELLIVISECTDRVREEFLNSQKGITILKGEGGYSSNTQRVILCAAEKKDCLDMRREIKRVDPKALIIITSTSKVEGKGFGYLI